MSFGPIMRFTVGDLQIELAAFSKDDLSEFINPGMNQVSINRYLARHNSHTIEDEQEWYEKVRKDTTSVTWGIWLVEADRKTLIGSTAFHDVFISPALYQQATSGSMIFRKEYWGKGIASAAHKARTWYGFQHMGLHRIMSAVVQGNIGSRTALSRSGYTLVYVERNTVFVDGSPRHQDNLECLNPNEPFWSHWWRSERPTKRTAEARQLTRDVLSWAETNVELA
ncbi:GNAT family N-acetyltransferase [Candidatus Saccharibacteria bacterium]|nr:GNAT family N-acetyltransferase [Candidatus Saccharibacteria bacterium]